MKDLKPVFVDSVDKIDPKYWEILDCGANVYYTPEFLKAFETANPDIDFTYIIILEGEEPVAFANTQLVSISVKTITKNIKMSAWLKRAINWLLSTYRIKILFVGNVFLSGEYGTFLRQDKNKIVTFNAIAKAVRSLSRSKRMHGIFVKDFKEDSLYITNHLEDHDYAIMQVEPNMIIHLNAEWKTFEDYKTALKSKYRVKANKADSTSQSLQAKLFTDKDVYTYKDELQALYENTIANANFNAQVLNLNTYINLKEIYHNKFIVKGYFLEGKLVGFLSAMVNQENLDAHFIGLDYSLNKEYAIYPRILNDYVRLGIELGSKRINLGRTASEIKSTLGAEPEDLICYFKHKRTFVNRLIKPFTSNIKIKSYKQHQPFKT
ncbi:MAG: N-acetyltransferase [Bacteroidia bacterium]|nr:N-acetyltransferase [Bacteroidia bacterium]MBT8309830.1 N-acetyltransferase [Bacteroidia bacterium]NNK27016.1 hypothetical protein [Flavobacteriaceae bacterium]NNL61050.1 hypothetical protein [Flavobacteriaceae bacterium]RZV69369.1 MAG: hypothetical protein EX254_01330 [Flavobacteriaceae bacterium]